MNCYQYKNRYKNLLYSILDNFYINSLLYFGPSYFNSLRISAISCLQNFHYFSLKKMSKDGINSPFLLYPHQIVIVFTQNFARFSFYLSSVWDIKILKRFVLCIVCILFCLSNLIYQLEKRFYLSIEIYVVYVSFS